MADTIIFDFDGTIADSERLMLSSLASIAGEFGFKAISPDEVPRLRKMSVRQLVAERLGIPLWRALKLRRLEKRSKEEFAKHAAMLSVFPGMSDILSELRMNGYTVGVVSSAPQRVVEDVLREGGMSMNFIHAGSGTFGKARAIRKALKKHGIDKSRAVYVGDELRDIDACRRAGIPMLGVGWGLNDALTLRGAGIKVASTPSELFSMITASE